MTTGWKITDLPALGAIPTGAELVEVSTGGTLSSKVALAVLANGLQDTNVSSSGTTTIGASQYGAILVSVNGAVTIQLPAASLRLGVPVPVADVGGFAQTHNITILPNGIETIMGQASLAISSSYGAYTLWPISTGGWYTR